MARLRTPWGTVRTEEGPLPSFRADDGRAALWAVGLWQGRNFPVPAVLGLARGEGRLALLEEGERAFRSDSLAGGLGLLRAAAGRLARAGGTFRRLWEAYALGLREGLGGYGPADPVRLAAWDLLFASLPEAERLLAGPGPRRASNAAALGGRRTRGGGALLWLDPHVPLGPRGEFLVHPLLVRSPEYTACGLARAGSPFVLAGSGPRTAWTLCASWRETVAERRGPAGRGWWRPPGERVRLRPAFFQCPLPSLWAFRAARVGSASVLARISLAEPPMAHTHLIAADGKGGIAWCLGVCPGGGRGEGVDRGGEEGYLVQCNASPRWIRPGREGEPGGDASFRHLRARRVLDRLVGSPGRAGREDLADLALDLRDLSAERVVRAAREAGAPRAFREALNGFRGECGPGSPKAALAYLLEGALLEEEPGLGGAFHLAGALEEALDRLDGETLRRAAARAFRRWVRGGRPAWGRLHGGRGGSLDTLLASGGDPWGPRAFAADQGSLLPMVVRLNARGASILLLDPAGRRIFREVRLPV